METLYTIKEKMEKLSLNTTLYFEKDNYQASIRARKTAMELRELMDVLRQDILDERKKREPLKKKKKK